jgi:hypothetical protein
VTPTIDFEVRHRLGIWSLYRLAKILARSRDKEKVLRHACEAANAEAALRGRPVHVALQDEEGEPSSIFAVVPRREPREVY